VNPDPHRALVPHTSKLLYMNTVRHGLTIEDQAQLHMYVAPPPTMDSISLSQIKLDAGISQIFFDCDNTLVNTEETSFEAASTVINRVLSDQYLARDTER